MGTTIAYACVCHVGRIRKMNQDNYMCERMYRHNDKDTRVYPFTGNVSTKQCSVFGVFDGLGGEQRGEMSSYIAASLAAQTVWKGNLKKELYDYCIRANEEICEFAKRENLRSTGTTVAMLGFQGNKMYLCNLGDSRIFRITKQAIEQISKDHVIQGMGGKKPPLAQCLGIPKEEFLIEPYITKISYNIGDRFLICSDGVTDMVEESEIHAIVRDKSLKKASKKLLNQALAKGGRDNTTLILLDIQRDSKGFLFF